MDILARMEKDGISQVEMIKTLKQRNKIIVQPAEMSQILNGILTTPKATRVVRAVMEVLDEVENGAD